jgi:YegS/Rv2252/BmrU family lipid kinase
MESPQLKRSLFILNTSAGIQPVKFILSKELQRRRHDLSYFKSLSIDDSGSHIKQSFAKYDTFIAAGGDGTVRTVASELVGTSKVLGVLPMGSGNGFAREFGFKPNIPSLIKDINKAEHVNIDIIQLNDQLCLNVAGIGLDSYVAHSFNKLKTRGLWSYVWVTLKNFIFLRPVRITLELENQTINEDLFVLSLANTRQFGNNAYIAPAAKPNDGIIDIVMIRPFPKILSFIIIYRLFRGTLRDSKYVHYIKTDKPFTIKSDETRFHIDGEAITFNGEVKVSIRRDALSVLKTRRNRL